MLDYMNIYHMMNYLDMEPDYNPLPLFDFPGKVCHH